MTNENGGKNTMDASLIVFFLIIVVACVAAFVLWNYISGWFTPAT